MEESGVGQEGVELGGHMCIFFHDWYLGCFRYPVYGRWERHCLECGRKEYRVGRKWTVYTDDEISEETKAESLERERLHAIW